jgi:hypothetical protein
MTSVHASRSTAAGALAALLFAVLVPMGASGAAMSPDAPYDPSFAPLTRIGDQLNRGDVLTGHGARAPFWIPELP